MEKQIMENTSLTPNYEVLRLKQIDKAVGGYRLGSGPSSYIQVNLTYKPNIIHRTMMRWLLGWRWVDSGV